MPRAKYSRACTREAGRFAECTRTGCVLIFLQFRARRSRGWLKDIEQQVNDEIRHNTVETNISSLEDALASGALAFFGDKYPESNVRVVTIPDERSPRGFYSKELCGGTHVHRIGDIGVLKIISEGSVAAGVRRIEAVTGIGALEHYEQHRR
jgi:alanyl-tRNA synthetase